MKNNKIKFKNLFKVIFAVVLTFSLIVGFQQNNILAKNAVIGEITLDKSIYAIKSLDKKDYKIIKTTKTTYSNGTLKTKTYYYESTIEYDVFHGKLIRYYNTKGKEIKAILIQENQTLNEKGEIEHSLFTKTIFSNYKKAGKHWGYTKLVAVVYSKEKGYKDNKLYYKAAVLPNGKKAEASLTFYLDGVKGMIIGQRYNKKGQVIRVTNHTFDKKGRKETSSYYYYGKKDVVVKTVIYEYDKKGRKKSRFIETCDKKGKPLVAIYYKYNAKGKKIAGEKWVYEKDKTYYYVLKKGKWVLTKEPEKY